MDVKISPCTKCEIRRVYAYADYHFHGEDCPFVCEEWENYKKEEEKKDDQMS